MNFLITKAAPRAMAAVCTDDELRISLTDGRWLSVPIIWFPRLANASAFERASYEGIHQVLMKTSRLLAYLRDSRRLNPKWHMLS